MKLQYWSNKAAYKELVLDGRDGDEAAESGEPESKKEAAHAE